MLFVFLFFSFVFFFYFLFMFVLFFFFFFFFQAEDGIRDLTVTGVQTCALPIYTRAPARPTRRRATTPRLRRTPRLAAAALVRRRSGREPAARFRRGPSWCRWSGARRRSRGRRRFGCDGCRQSRRSSDRSRPSRCRAGAPRPRHAWRLPPSDRGAARRDAGSR